METELKMLVADEDRARVAGLAPIRKYAHGRALRRRLVNIYYDTPARDGLKRGLMVRLRRQGGIWILCVKGRGERRGGLHRRLEFEAEMPGPELDFSRLPDDPAIRPFLKGKLAARLEPVFETTFWRTTRELALPDGGLVECCVDKGVIRAGGQVLPISEVELELKSGEASLLYELAESMGRSIRLHPSNISKAERGYRLLSGKVPGPVKAVRPGLRSSMTVEQAFETILWNGLEQIQANEEAVLQSRDPEALHQFRVGQRRMRTALTLFRTAVPGQAAAPVREGLRRLGADTGPARDLDVLLHEYLEPILAACTGEHPVAETVRRAREQQDQSYRQLNETLLSHPYSRLLLSLSAWIATRGWRLAMEPAECSALNEPVLDLATPLLARRHRLLLKQGRKLAQLDDDALHTLRIDIKKQRYAVEFFEALYKRKAARAYRNGLRDLQDQLGRLNDFGVAGGLLAGLRDNGAENQADPVACFIEGWFAKDRARGRKRLAKAWSAFANHKPFW